MPHEPLLVRKQSFGSVTVFSLDREAALARVQAAARQLRAVHPEVEEVWLVGSLARGEARPGSDVDLLVLLRATNEPLLDRIGRLLRDWSPVGMGVDFLPFAREEFESRLAGGDPFLTRLSVERRRLA